MAIIVVKNVSFCYGDIPALDNVSVKIDTGEVVSIVGPNGSGKTTLLKCIDNLLRPKRGDVLVMGKKVARLSLEEISKMIGYVPQTSVRTIFPFTVFDLVLMGRKPYISWEVSRKDRRIVAETLDFLGISKFAMRYVSDLSGGEQQKVLIARALAQKPKCLLLDEPTSNLDIKHQLEVLDLIKRMAKEKHLAVVVAIHDLNLASRFSDTTVMLKHGKLFAMGSPRQVLTRKNIEEVYGVRVKVFGDDELGYIHIAPVSTG